MLLFTQWPSLKLWGNILFLCLNTNSSHSVISLSRYRIEHDSISRKYFSKQQNKNHLIVANWPIMRNQLASYSLAINHWSYHQKKKQAVSIIHMVTGNLSYFVGKTLSFFLLSQRFALRCTIFNFQGGQVTYISQRMLIILVRFCVLDWSSI